MPLLHVICAGERHGTPAERLLAAQRRANQAEKSRPHTLFATGPQQQPQHIPEGQQQAGAFRGKLPSAGAKHLSVPWNRMSARQLCALQAVALIAQVTDQVVTMSAALTSCR